MVIGIAINELIKKRKFYKNISNIELIKSRLVYQIIGISIIKWLVTKTFWRKINPKLILKKKIGLTELRNLSTEMTYAEISHLIGFILVILFSVTSIIYAEIEFGIILMITNVIFNLYPALLQQKNKRKINDIIKTIISSDLAK